MPTRPPTHQPHGSRQARERQRKRELDRRRGHSAARLYDRRWRKARDAYVREHPLCCICERAGEITPTYAVDHIEPHRDNPALFWDQANWQPLCERHHNAKTAHQVATQREGG